MSLLRAAVLLLGSLCSTVSFAAVSRIKMGDLDMIQVEANTGNEGLQTARQNIPSDFREYKEWLSPIVGCEVGFSYLESKDICENRAGDIDLVQVFLTITLK